MYIFWHWLPEKPSKLLSIPVSHLQNRLVFCAHNYIICGWRLVRLLLCKRTQFLPFPTWVGPQHEAAEKRWWWVLLSESQGKRAFCVWPSHASLSFLLVNALGRHWLINTVSFLWICSTRQWKWPSVPSLQRFLLVFFYECWIIIKYTCELIEMIP